MNKDVHVVIGANCGDEGKGLITAKIANAAINEKKSDFNVLTNGGAQRGHSFIYQGKKIINKHFGRASVLGCTNYFSAKFILDPMQFTAEYSKKANEFETFRHTGCIRSKYCRWATPFDIMANQAEAKKQQLHNTCGMGIWNTIKRSNIYNELFDNFIAWNDLHKKDYLKRIANYYLSTNDFVSSSEEYSPFFNDPVLLDGIIDHFIADCSFMYIKTLMTDDADGFDMTPYDTIIFENGQGLGIGDTCVDDKFKTPTFTGLKALPNNLNKSMNFSDESTIHYVSRTYETRHGDDEIFVPVKRKVLSSYIEEDFGNQYNEWQGEFKYKPLNCTLLSNRILKDLLDKEGFFGNINPLNKKVLLELTHCDEMTPDGIVCPVVDKIIYNESAEI